MRLCKTTTCTGEVIYVSAYSGWAHKRCTTDHTIWPSSIRPQHIYKLIILPLRPIDLAFRVEQKSSAVKYIHPTTSIWKYRTRNKLLDFTTHMTQVKPVLEHHFKSFKCIILKKLFSRHIYWNVLWKLFNADCCQKQLGLVCDCCSCCTSFKRNVR